MPSDAAHVPPDLQHVLRVLVEGSAELLGDDFVGAYLHGSFALGDADEHSDADWLVVTRSPDVPVAELQEFHRRFHDRPRPWFRGTEGSYVPTASLRRPSEEPWWFVDHQDSATLELSPHCNTLVVRWVLREHGITLAGPPAADLVDPVDPDALRAESLARFPRFFEDLESWMDWRSIEWGQRTAVETLARMLATVRTGRVLSKPAALRWARAELDDRWGPLLTDALEGRARGFDVHTAPAPELVAATRAFADHTASLAHLERTVP
ncbi:aminoglycoside adenylyltransferase domain-containing protein [Kineococcus sp. GCM10028916]|uniref:aminoglycoside adenylyltransferase domain-containing protein n=1 Tax=Kineococcus sp. GCM10028916 TaxID=3273394 RepID=UPI00363978B6